MFINKFILRISFTALFCLGVLAQGKPAAKEQAKVPDTCKLCVDYITGEYGNRLTVQTYSRFSTQQETYPGSGKFMCIPCDCGDGVVEPELEECDSGADNGKYRCSNDCKLRPSFCGDKVKDANEECDDGNKNNKDQCTESCKLVKK